MGAVLPRHIEVVTEGLRDAGVGRVARVGEGRALARTHISSLGVGPRPRGKKVPDPKVNVTMAGAAPEPNEAAQADPGVKVVEAAGVAAVDGVGPYVTETRAAKAEANTSGTVVTKAQTVAFVAGRAQAEEAETAPDTGGAPGVPSQVWALERPLGPSKGGPWVAGFRNAPPAVTPRVPETGPVPRPPVPATASGLAPLVETFPAALLLVPFKTRRLLLVPPYSFDTTGKLTSVYGALAFSTTAVAGSRR